MACTHTRTPSHQKAHNCVDAHEASFVKAERRTLEIASDGPDGRDVATPERPTTLEPHPKAECRRCSGTATQPQFPRRGLSLTLATESTSPCLVLSCSHAISVSEAGHSGVQVRWQFDQHFVSQRSFQELVVWSREEKHIGRGNF